jgi:hypothetical protein
LGGEVDVAAVVGDKNVLVSATRFHGQLTGDQKPRETVRMKGGSRRMWGQGNPRGTGWWRNEERRVRGRVGRGIFLEERRFFLTTSR